MSVIRETNENKQTNPRLSASRNTSAYAHTLEFEFYIYIIATFRYWNAKQPELTHSDYTLQAHLHSNESIY